MIPNLGWISVFWRFAIGVNSRSCGIKNNNLARSRIFEIPDSFRKPIVNRATKSRWKLLCLPIMDRDFARSELQSLLCWFDDGGRALLRQSACDYGQCNLAETPGKNQRYVIPLIMWSRSGLLFYLLWVPRKLIFPIFFLIVKQLLNVPMYF